MKFRIVDYNYAALSETIVSATTSDASYPSSNIKKEFRSKVWRSNKDGYFKIDSSNKYVDFKQSAVGAEITATLTEGEYTATTLATHISSAMTAADPSSDEYTCSKSTTTGKFTFTTTGTYLSLLNSTGTNAANSVMSDLGFDTSDHTGALTYTGAAIACHSSHGERVVFDLMSAQDVNSVALFFDPTVGSRLSKSAVVKLEGHYFDEWSSPDYSLTLPFLEMREVYAAFLNTAIKYRYLSINVIDQANANLQVELGKVVLGKFLDLQRLPRNGFTFTRVDQSDIQRTAYGHEYGDIYPTLRRLGVEYSAMNYYTLKQLDNSFIRVGRTNPILVSLDPGEDNFDREMFLLYCKYDADMEPTHRIRQFFDNELQFREVM